MSTELSRVNSHKRRKQEDKQKRAQKRQELVSELKRSKRPKTTIPSASQTNLESTSTRTRRKPASEPAPVMELDDSAPIPARTETYASKKIKISKYFINTLIILFVLLTAFLLWWGVMDAPPLEELW